MAPSHHLGSVSRLVSWTWANERRVFARLGGCMHTVGQGGLDRGSPAGLVKRGGGHE